VALQLLQSLCTAVTECNFKIDNPYIFKTKADVVTSLSTNQAAHLIPYTCSCAHLMFKSKTQWHCGSCSQCIDRRFAITASGLLEYDLDSDYVSDVFVGPRKDGPERSMAVDYARHGIELDRWSESELAARFNAELSRAVRYEPKRSETAQEIISMHKRHGEVVTRVLQRKVIENAAKLVDGTLDSTSLLALAIGQERLRQQRFAGEGVHGNMDHDSNIGPASLIQSQVAAVARVEGTLATILARLGGLTSKKVKTKKKRKLVKRDAVTFAAILMELKSTKYCSFLQDHGTKPSGQSLARPPICGVTTLEILSALLTTAYSFAFRKGELLSMRVKQIDLPTGTIRLEAGTTKNGEGRAVKMTREVATLLTACIIGKQPDDFVFTRSDKKRKDGTLVKGKPVEAFRKIWKAVCTRAGVPDLLFHDLRRSGVRNLRRLGVQESVVMRISGHKTRSVFERYNIVDEADLADAASRLDTKQNAAAVELTQTFGHDCGQLHQNCGRCADAACKCRSA